MRFAAVLLGAFAFLGGVDLIVFSPVPVPAACRFEPLIAALDGMPPGLFGYHPRWARYYYRTWPPVASAGIASIAVGVYLRRRRRREEVRDLPEVELEVLDQVGADDLSDASDRAARLGDIP